MNMGVLRTTTVLVIAVSLFSCVASNSCYAPANYWGRVCSSNTGVFGSSGHRVRYSVSVGGNAATLVCCQGYSAADRKFHGIGCSHGSFSWTLEWGNYIDKPKIKCRGGPFGAAVSWSH